MAVEIPNLSEVTAPKVLNVHVTVQVTTDDGQTAERKFIHDARLFDLLTYDNFVELVTINLKHVKDIENVNSRAVELFNERIFAYINSIHPQSA